MILWKIKLALSFWDQHFDSSGNKKADKCQLEFIFSLIHNRPNDLFIKLDKRIKG